MSELDKNWTSTVDARLGKLEERISSIEQRLSDAKKVKTTTRRQSSKGPTGAIRLLIDEGFLDKPKLAKEVKAELDRLGHYYTLQVVDATLRQMNKSKVLTRVGQKGEWRYAVRK